MRLFTCRLLAALVSTLGMLACSDHSTVPPVPWSVSVVGTVTDRAGKRVAADVTMRIVRLWPHTGTTQLGNCVGDLTVPQVQTTAATGNYVFQVTGEGVPLLACVVVQATSLTPNWGNGFAQVDSIILGPTGVNRVEIEVQLDR